jgi:hypothetical protein
MSDLKTFRRKVLSNETHFYAPYIFSASHIVVELNESEWTRQNWYSRLTVPEFSGLLRFLDLSLEADHSPPASAEVENGGAIPPLPPRFSGIVLNQLIKHRDNFTFALSGVIKNTFRKLNAFLKYCALWNTRRWTKPPKSCLLGYNTV